MSHSGSWRHNRIPWISLHNTGRHHDNQYVFNVLIPHGKAKLTTVDLIVLLGYTTATPRIFENTHQCDTTGNHS